MREVFIALSAGLMFFTLPACGGDESSSGDGSSGGAGAVSAAGGAGAVAGMGAAGGPINTGRAGGASRAGAGGGTASNAPPVASPATATTRHQGTVRVEIPITDDGIGDGPLALVLRSGPENGTATVDGTMVTYSPNEGFTGDDTVDVAPTDGLAEGAAVTVTINVVEGTVYYVAPGANGSDAAPGTRDRPLNTVYEASLRDTDSSEIVLLEGRHSPSQSASLKGIIRGDDLTQPDDVVVDFAGQSYRFTLSSETTLAGLTLQNSATACLEASLEATISDVIIEKCNPGVVLLSVNPASVTFERVRFVDNTATGRGGGAIFGGVQPITLRDCHLQRNHAPAAAPQGGAIYTEGRLTVEGCTFEDNTAAQDGGAIAAVLDLFSDPFSVDISKDTVFRGNEALGSQTNEGRGGAIFAAEDVAVSIERTRFLDNVAGTSGGALHVVSAGVDEALFRGNETTRTSGGGGAIFTEGAGHLTVERTLFDGNVSAASAGAIRVRGDSAAIAHSTFTANEGGVTAGVLCGDGPSDITVGYSTIKGNIARPQSSTYAAVTCGANYDLRYVILDNPGLPDCSSVFGIDSVTQSLSSDDTCTDFPASARNVDPALGALADNGGFTESFLPGAASPAVDALGATGRKCPDTAELSAAFDQRGVERPQGLACDIGAVER